MLLQLRQIPLLPVGFVVGGLLFVAVAVWLVPRRRRFAEARPGLRWFWLVFPVAVIAGVLSLAAVGEFYRVRPERSILSFVVHGEFQFLSNEAYLGYKRHILTLRWAPPMALAAAGASLIGWRTRRF